MYTQSQIADLFKVLGNPFLEVSDFHLQNKMAVVSLKKREQFSETCPTSNLILATTTSSSHYRLYKSLDIVQKCTIYTDTDSIVYLMVPGKTNLEPGHLLGQLMSKLKFGDHIIQICINHAKNYAYQICWVMRCVK